MKEVNIIMLQKDMQVILESYNHHRFSQPGVDQNSIVYQLVEKKLPEYIREVLNDDKFKVSGSVGAGRWAEVPWVGIFNKNITTSAQKGFYVCYLFGNGMDSVYLTIIHSITKEHSGKSWKKEKIKTFVQNKRENLKEHITNIKVILENGINIEDPNSFGNSSRANKYTESTIAYKEYQKDNLPSEEVLINDLKLFIELYDCMDLAEKRGIYPKGVDEMAYSSETGNVNVDILYNDLNLSRKGAEVVFQNEDLFVISPSIQNGSNWFDIRKLNLDRFKESKKRGFLILRHGETFLFANLKDFAQTLMITDFLRSSKTGGDHWKFNIEAINDQYFVYNQGNKNVLYTMNFGDRQNLKTSIEKVLHKVEPYKAIEEIRNRENKSEIVKEIPETLANNQIIPHIHTYLTQKGFLYSQQNIANLYLSLCSKPFVILSGISGTGKTKVVQLFANAVGATQDNGRYQLIPVRPDWSDSSDLLGYTDLKGDFVKGQLTEMVIRAAENPEFPHFVVLDEMNLARVEYYLSDFLSVIESRDRQNGKMTTATLVRVDEKEYELPDNLYIIGTVNMDETTYPFSKKVLDRANSIEFNDINLTSYSMLMNPTEEVSPVNVHNDQFASQYLFLKEAYPQYQEIIEDVSEQLDEINQQLKITYAQVGYRVRDEICFYMIYNKEMGLLEEDEAMDFCILQKILPRISGAGSDVEDLLKGLFNEFAGKEYKEEMEIPTTATYPQSAKKVQEMLKRLGRQGFTSFWVS